MIARRVLRGLRAAGLRVEIEVSAPWQTRPGWFSSPLMTRAWWGCLAVAIKHVPEPEYLRRAAWFANARGNQQ